MSWFKAALNIALLLVLAVGSNHAGAQEGGRHRVALGIGHTAVIEGWEDNKKEVLVMPSWALDYDYRLSRLWAVGMQTELVTKTFFIERRDGEVIERGFPLTLVPVGLVSPWQHITFMAGIGAEIASEQSYVVSRLGMEFGWELPENWEISVNLVWDNKIEYYDSFSLTLAIGHLF